MEPLRCTGRGSGRNQTSALSTANTLREVKVSTEPVAIRSALEGFADRPARVEASSLGKWLHRELHPSGLPIIFVETRTCGCRCQ